MCCRPTRPAARVLEDHARRILGAAGYQRIETPTFEATELFARGVGEATDIVQKEMYTFDDGGGRSLTLRPEGTAPVCRAYMEHGMHKLPQPVKFWYLGSFYPRRGPAARALPPVLAGGGGGDRVAVARDRRRADRAPVGPAAGDGGAGDAAAAVEPRHAGDPGGVPRGADRLSARPRGRPLARGGGADRPQPDARLRCRRPHDAGDDARRADAAGPPRCRGCRALRPGARPARRRRPALRARPDAGARPRLLHAHGLRVHLRRARGAIGSRRRRSLRRPDGAARRAADARLGLGGRASSGSCSPPASSRSPPMPSTCSSRWRSPRPRPCGLRARQRGPPGGTARADGAGRALAQGPAQARRPDRRTLRCDHRRRADG